MERLEVSGTVRPLYGSLGVKGLFNNEQKIIIYSNTTSLYKQFQRTGPHRIYKLLQPHLRNVYAVIHFPLHFCILQFHVSYLRHLKTKFSRS